MSQGRMGVRRSLEWLRVWCTSIERAALIVSEGVGITVADELVLLVFEPGLAVDRLYETYEAGCLLGVVAG